MLKTYLKLFGIFVLATAGLAVALDVFLFGGAHPECAFNDSVGPCEFVPRVSQYMAYIAVFVLPFFVILAGEKYMKSRRKSNNKK